MAATTTTPDGTTAGLTVGDTDDSDRYVVVASAASTTGFRWDFAVLGGSGRALGVGAPDLTRLAARITANEAAILALQGGTGSTGGETTGGGGGTPTPPQTASSLPAAAQALADWQAANTRPLREADPRKLRDTLVGTGGAISGWPNSGTAPDAYSGAAKWLSSATGFAGPVFDLEGGAQLISGGAQGEPNDEQPISVIVIASIREQTEAAWLSGAGDAGRTSGRTEIYFPAGGAGVTTFSGTGLSGGVPRDTAVHSYGQHAASDGGVLLVDDRAPVEGAQTNALFGHRLGGWRTDQFESSPVIGYAAVYQGLTREQFEAVYALTVAMHAEAWPGASYNVVRDEPAPPPISTALTASQHWRGQPLAAVNDHGNFVMIDRTSRTFTIDEAIEIDHIVMNWRYNSPADPNGGYSNGDGGTYLVELYADDGSGAPTGPALFAYGEVIDRDNRPNSSISNSVRPADFTAVTIQPGRYHIVVTNTHADRANNWSSLNGPISGSAAGPDQVKIDPARPLWRTLVERNGAWIDAETQQFCYRPQWGIRTTSNEWVGQEVFYGELLGETVDVTGPNRIRQKMTISALDGDENLSELHVHVGRAGGDTPLIISLDGVDVATIEGLPVVPEPASEITRDARHFDWRRVPLPSALTAGREYVFEFRAGAPEAGEEAGVYRVLLTYLGSDFTTGDVLMRADRTLDGGATYGSFRDRYAPRDLPLASVAMFASTPS